VSALAATGHAPPRRAKEADGGPGDQARQEFAAAGEGTGSVQGERLPLSRMWRRHLLACSSPALPTRGGRLGSRRTQGHGDSEGIPWRRKGKRATDSVIQLLRHGDLREGDNPLL